MGWEDAAFVVQYHVLVSCNQGMSVSVVGLAEEEAEWQLQHAQHVEKALLSQQSSMAAIGQAVAAVSRDVQPGSLPHSSFLVAAAEGLLFEGLASLLRQVDLLPSHPFSSSSLLPSSPPCPPIGPFALTLFP